MTAAKSSSETEGTRRLLAFPTPENYAESWLIRLREMLNRPATIRVLEGLDEEHRTIV